MEQVVCTHCGYVATAQDVREKFDALHADLETTINQRDRAVEDLRACAEALNHASLAITSLDDCIGQINAANVLLQQDPIPPAFFNLMANALDAREKARAALARPGVQEEMKK